MYASYEASSLWPLLQQPPQGLKVDFVKAERSNFRWGWGCRGKHGGRVCWSERSAPHAVLLGMQRAVVPTLRGKHAGLCVVPALPVKQQTAVGLSCWGSLAWCRHRGACQDVLCTMEAL
jgi:hypothetical protein